MSVSNDTPTTIANTITFGEMSQRECAVVGCSQQASSDVPTLQRADATTAVVYEFCTDHGRQIETAVVKPTWEYPPGRWWHDGIESKAFNPAERWRL